MAYSNTNKDKRQIGKIKSVKQAVFYGVIIFIVGSSLINLFRQWTTLIAANNRLKQLETKISEQKAEIKRYNQLIEDATSSATIERKQRQDLGLGTDNDRWLILPTETQEKSNIIVFEENQDKSNIMKWWDLFTKIR